MKETSDGKTPTFRFLAYIDTEGMLTVTPYPTYEEYCRILKRPEVQESVVFGASGHVEARREARLRLGHLETEPSLSQIFEVPKVRNRGGASHD